MSGLPLFERSSRRTLLKRGLALGSVVTAGVWLAACGNDDKAVFATATGAGGTGTGGTVPGGPTTTVASSTAPAQTTVPTSSSIVAATGDMAVAIDFSYTPGGSGGRIRNPYVAAWVEDANGTMVALVFVWYSSRESKYLRELTGFATAARGLTSAELDAVSGATRTAGVYALRWDGKGFDGTVLTGRHTLWIEAAREHGPHSATSGPVDLGRPGTATLTADGELSAVTVTVG